ncbi:MAG: hypothetical protein CMJ40_08805 [Phycisphaerae bacterium]|nr:hypothetical protein [Phycisphaerae bacterium]|tara:strand:- start:287 stop:1351 length:1065 start_codon:yes stop_codon:yes gene_type:complete
MAHGQSDRAPENLDRISSVTNLDAAQISKINAYGEYWSAKLNDDSPSEVKKARNMLVRSLRLVGGKSASLAFRSTMSKAILKKLQSIIEDADTYKAINAIQIASSLGTPRAVETLEDHLEIEDEKRPEIRLWAAIGLGRAFEFKDGLRSDALKGSLRALGRAAEVETDPLVLQREMESIDMGVRNQRPDNVGGKEIRDFAVDTEIAVLETTINRIRSGAVSPSMLKALQPSLVLIRNQYIDPQLQQTNRSGKNGRNEKLATFIGRKTAPKIADIYDIVIIKSSDLRSDPELSEATGRLLESSEATLKLVDKNLRGNQSNVKNVAVRNLWDKGQLEELEATRDQWQAIMAAPPYK